MRRVSVDERIGRVLLRYLVVRLVEDGLEDIGGRARRGHKLRYFALDVFVAV